MSLPKGKKLLVIFLTILIFIYLVLSYFIKLKVNKDVFHNSSTESSQFVESYTTIPITNKNVSFKLYQIGEISEKPVIFYFPNKNGPLNHIINSLAPNYTIFTVQYPMKEEYQNTEKLSEIIDISFSYLQENLHIQPTKIILFGHEIGANVAFHFSKNTTFKDVILFNKIPSLYFYCKKSFFAPLCFLTSKDLYKEDFSPNNVYMFFNENNFTSPEERYKIFNKINSNDKFFFEIPGTSADFNFNHIIDFYNNETMMQQDKGSEKKESVSEDDAFEGDNDGVYILDADGLLNDEKYID